MLVLCVLCTVHVCVLYQYSYVQCMCSWLVSTHVIQVYVVWAQQCVYAHPLMPTHTSV